MQEAESKKHKSPLSERERLLSWQVKVLADRCAFALAAVEEQWDISFEAGDIKGCTHWERVKALMVLTSDETMDEYRKLRRKEKPYLRALHYVRGILTALMERSEEKRAA